MEHTDKQREVSDLAEMVEGKCQLSEISLTKDNTTTPKQPITFEDLSSEIRLGIFGYALELPPYHLVLMGGKLAAWAEDVCTAVEMYNTLQDAVSVSASVAALTDEIYEVGRELLGTINCDMAEFSLLDDICECEWTRSEEGAGTRFAQPDIQGSLYELTLLCRNLSNKSLVEQLTAIDGRHMEAHDFAAQVAVNAQHQHLMHLPGPTCGVLKYANPSIFCSPQCEAAGPWDDYTPEDIEQHADRLRDHASFNRGVDAKPYIANWRYPTRDATHDGVVGLNAANEQVSVC